MSSKNDPLDISYYRLSLTDFLRESHPALFFDNNLIAVRSEAATEAYGQAVQKAKDRAIRLYPECEAVFDKYTLSNDFAYERNTNCSTRS
jgi:hypothetical protein